MLYFLLPSIFTFLFALHGPTCPTVVAFSVPHSRNFHLKTQHNLLYSSIGDDDEPSQENSLFKYPEDQLTLAGDVFSIFIYSFIDHEATWLFDSLSAASTNHALLPRVPPVWFNALNAAPFGSIPLISALPMEHHFIYSPAIIYPGLASVLLATFWIFTSTLTGALSFKNTLCDSRRALLITTLTWVFTALLVGLFAWASDGVIGHFDAYHKSVGLTRSDMDYIAGSLTVLLFWRFIVSTLIGSGGDSTGK